MNVLEILQRENPWWQRGQILQDYRDKRKRPYCYKVLLESIKWFKDHRVLLMEGPRQVGKSLILQHIVDELLKTGIPPQAICYIDLQVPDIRSYVSENSLDHLLNYYLKNIAPPRLTESSLPFFPLLLLDEIQHADQWSDWLKKFADDPRFKAKIIATGSAMRLSYGKRESGVGRWPTLYIPHLTLYEYLQVIIPQTEKSVNLIGSKPFWDWRFPKRKELEEIRKSISYSDTQQCFNDYLAKGGYPHPATQKTEIAQKNIRDIITSRLLQDPVDLKIIRGGLELEKLFFYLAAHTGDIFSKDNIGKESGLNRPTLNDYLRCLEDIHLIWRLPLYKNTGTKAVKSNEKIHVGTPCIANSLKPSEAFGSLRGPLLESSIASSLYPIAHDLNGFISYWRESSGGKEVDIVFEWPEGLIPIEVKSGGNKSGLAKFREKFSSSMKVSYLLKDEDEWDYREEKNNPFIVMPVSYFLYFLNSTDLIKCEQEWNEKTRFPIEVSVVNLELPDSLKNSQTFRDNKRKEFTQIIQEKPFYRIMVGPQELESGMQSISRSLTDLILLLQNPPQIREGISGTWHPGVGYSVTPQSFMEGIKAEYFYDQEGKRRYKSLFLYFNGALEFFVPIDKSFLLNKEHQNHWVNPYPLIEYTVNFFRLFKKVSQFLELKGSFWFELQLENIKNLVLQPGHPRSMAYMYPTHNLKDYVLKEKSILINGAIPYLNPYKDDVEAYEILKSLYFRLGLREETLPFFEKDGTCLIT